MPKALAHFSDITELSVISGGFDLSLLRLENISLLKILHLINVEVSFDSEAIEENSKPLELKEIYLIKSTLKNQHDMFGYLIKFAKLCPLQNKLVLDISCIASPLFLIVLIQMIQLLPS